MLVRPYLLRFITGPLVGALFAFFLVMAFTVFNSGLSERVYGQDCVDVDNLNDNGSDNGNNNDNSNDNDNDNGSLVPGDSFAFMEVFEASVAYAQDNGNDNSEDNDGNGDQLPVDEGVSCVPSEAAIGAQPLASDTERGTLGNQNPTVQSPDGVATLQWAGGGDVRYIIDPADPNTGPAHPLGLRQIRALNLNLVPDATPNNLNITLHYTDSDLGGMSEDLLRMFYWSPGLGQWVEVPATIDPAANTVTWMNLDVGAFSGQITRIALFI